MNNELKTHLAALTVALKQQNWHASAETVQQALTEICRLERYAYPERTYLPKKGDPHGHTD